MLGQARVIRTIVDGLGPQGYHAQRIAHWNSSTPIQRFTVDVFDALICVTCEGIREIYECAMFVRPILLYETNR